MKKLLFISLLCISNMFGYSELESQIFDAINNRDEKWAKDIIAQAEPLDESVKKVLLNEAEKAEKYLRKATKSKEHSYGDQVLSRFADFGMFTGSTTCIAAIIAAVLESKFAPVLGFLGCTQLGIGLWGKYKTYNCFWAYRKLRQAQGVVGIISGAQIKKH